jgi:FkbM family methyltransferase
MTRHLVAEGIFRASPFCLVDVGASGGIDRYWEVFGDSLQAFGFDGLVKEVERLNAAGRPGQRYFPYLVGDKSYEAPGGVPDSDPFPRTTAVRAAEITRCDYARTYLDQTGSGERATEMIELDDYFGKQQPADIDFIKVDTDGSDFQVLTGARELLSRGVLGLGVECQFHGKVHDQSNTFRNIDRLATGHGFSLFDIEVYRYSRAELPQRFVYRIPAQTERGQVLWGDVLYLRDAGSPRYERQWGISLPLPKLLKLACVFEMFGMEDCAAEVLVNRRAELAGMVDVGRCLELLTPPLGSRKLPYERYRAEFERDPSSFYPPA